MKRFPSKQKAIDLALWQNHNHRFSDDYGVALSFDKGDYMVVPKKHPSFKSKEFEVIPSDYLDMDFTHISRIAIDRDPLDHWKIILNFFATTHGEVLLFILNSKLPLEKFIRHELACRGYDNEFNLVGFYKAQEIWFK